MNWIEQYNFVGPRITIGCLEFRRGVNLGREKIKKIKAPKKAKVIRHSNDQRLKSWSAAVKERDMYKCTSCGSINNLHSHHIKSKRQYPELKYCIDNGVTLCSICHANVHGGILAGGLMNFPENVLYKNTIKVGRGGQNL